MDKIFGEIQRIANNNEYEHEQQQLNHSCIILTPEELLLILSLIHTAIYSDANFNEKNKKILLTSSIKLKEYLNDQLSHMTVKKHNNNINLTDLQKEIEKVEDRLFDELFPETVNIKNL